MRIEVLPQDITGAKTLDITQCPVARAIRRCTGSSFVEVDYLKALIAQSEGPEKNIPLPLQVGNIVRHYDQTGEMDPFGFEL